MGIQVRAGGNARSTRESGGSALAETRPFAFTPPFPAQLDARAPLPPSLTWSPHAEPLWRCLAGAAGIPVPGAALSPPLLKRGDRLFQEPIPVLLLPLTHPSTARVFKRLTRYPLPGDFKIKSENSKEKKIQLINNCTFTLLIFSSQKSAKSWQGTLQVSLT